MSIDAYRGLVMFLLMAEMLALHQVSKNLPGNGFWSFLSHHQDHVEWVGCVLHDLIQPSFSFLVGTALAFSLASRAARGQSGLQMGLHAVGRALALTFLGVFLRSVNKSQTNFTFEDTLSQIGMGYLFLFLLGRGSARAQWAGLAAILFGYWLAFALYPLPGADFDWARAGVTKDWEHNLTGFAAHWNKNTNLAWAFDTWFMNLWPRPTPFTHNGGGYSTLSFIPTLGTMVIGLIAGGWLRAPLTPRARLQKLLTAGVAFIAAALVLHALGICPIVKRIWTPTWTLFSGGCCMLLLAAFYGWVDVLGRRWIVFPLVVIGMNSIAAYCMEGPFAGYVSKALNTHLGVTGIFQVLGAPYEPLVRGILLIGTLWLILLWMYRRKIFLRL